jgi:hypothetical protein
MWILKIGVYDLSQIPEMTGIGAGFLLIFIISAGYLIGLLVTPISTWLYDFRPVGTNK